MVIPWLVKIMLATVLAGFGVVELGSPLWTRAQVDGAAHEVADEAGLQLRRSDDPLDARQVAERAASERRVTLEAFDIVQGRVNVTVSREAKSYLLHRFEPTRGWYDVEVSAASAVTTE